MYNALKAIIRFIAFLRNLLLTPRTFFRQYLAPEAPRPYWWVVVSLFFSEIFIMAQFNFRTSANFERISMANDAYLIDTLLLVFSLLAGLSGYFLSAWFMKLTILIYGGKASVEQARSIAFYTPAVHNMCSLLVFLISCLCGWWSFLVIAQIVCAVIFTPYLVYAHYCAVMTLPGTKKGRVIFFLILGMLLFCFVALGAIVEAR